MGATRTLLLPEVAPGERPLASPGACKALGVGAWTVRQAQASNASRCRFFTCAMALRSASGHLHFIKLHAAPASKLRPYNCKCDARGAGRAGPSAAARAWLCSAPWSVQHPPPHRASRKGSRYPSGRKCVTEWKPSLEAWLLPCPPIRRYRQSPGARLRRPSHRSKVDRKRNRFRTVSLA